MPLRMIIGGAAGTGLGLVCCLTPVIPALFGASALTAFLYRDSILLPFAALSFAIMIWGMVRLRRGRA